MATPKFGISGKVFVFVGELIDLVTMRRPRCHIGDNAPERRNDTHGESIMSPRCPQPRICCRCSKAGGKGRPRPPWRCFSFLNLVLIERLRCHDILVVDCQYRLDWPARRMSATLTPCEWMASPAKL